MRDLGPQDGSGIGSDDPNRAGPIDVALRLAVLGGFLLLVGILLRPFLGLMIWSAILTVALYPLHVWMTERLGGRAVLAAVLLTLLALVVVFGASAITDRRDVIPAALEAAQWRMEACLSMG